MNRADLQAMAQREMEKHQGTRCRLLCCASTPCLSSGATAVQAALKEAIAEQELNAQVALVATGCMGPCSRGPVVTLQVQGQDDVMYEQVTPEIARQIVAQHVAENEPVAQHVMPADLPFFAKQTKVVLSNSGLIDP
ncbi:MAG: (2Fe-2S) ferredoxin domain-containing protein, partial [Anaerolineae bacterium]